ncbi:hypothetical protein Trydic_g8474 [Trypoxylus dichotomus]
MYTNPFNRPHCTIRHVIDKFLHPDLHSIAEPVPYLDEGYPRRRNCIKFDTIRLIKHQLFGVTILNSSGADYFQR